MYNRTILSNLFVLLLLLFGLNAKASPILENIDGSTIDFSSLKGKWVFINYWASWCGPCIDEISALNKFSAENKSKNIEVFAVNFEDLPMEQQQYLVTKFSIHYPSLKHKSVNQLHLGDISVVPITFVFNPEGQLATALYGGQTLKSLREVIAQVQPLK